MFPVRVFGAALTLGAWLTTVTPASADLLRDGTRAAARLGQEPIPVRIVEDDTPGRGQRITGWVLLGVGAGLLALEAAYECHYGTFSDCSDPDKVGVIGGTALLATGGVLLATAPRGPRTTRIAPAPRPQVQYRIRF